MVRNSGAKAQGLASSCSKTDVVVVVRLVSCWCRVKLYGKVYGIWYMVGFLLFVRDLNER